MLNSTAGLALTPWARLVKRRIAPVAAVAAVLALTISMAIGGAAAAPNAGAAVAGTPALASAVPKYYVALPGGDNFGNVPGSATAVVGDTITGKRLLTVRPSGKDKFVSVSAAADDTTFVLGGNPDPEASLPTVAPPTDWYLVQIKPGSKVSATVRKLRFPAPAKNSFVDATALSPDGREVAVVGVNDYADAKQPLEWLRIYSVATGALLRSWSGYLNVNWEVYTTLSWTSGGRSLAIGYTFTVGTTKVWEYLGVRTLNVNSKGNSLIADSKLVWKRLLRNSWFGSPTPLNCALDIRVVVSADGSVVCSAFGSLRNYNPDATGTAPTCPSVPPWASLGFLSFSTVTGKQSTVFQYDTNCDAESDVLWTSASGDAVIGYYALGSLFPGSTQTVRFGVFSHDKYAQLPVPPTTTTVPETIAWLRCLAVGEAVDHQADGEVEAVVAGSGGELGGVALGVRESAGQRGVAAQQFVAADDPAAIAVAALLVH
jgi:hypothetical protein